MPSAMAYGTLVLMKKTRKKNQLAAYSNNSQHATTNDIEELAAITAKQFNVVDDRFNKVDDRFNKVDERFKKIDKRFNKVDDRLDQVDGRLGRLEHGQEAVLNILNENNQLLKELRGLPQRVERLERTVFRR